MLHAHPLVPEMIRCLKLYEISLSGTWAITLYKHHTMLNVVCFLLGNSPASEFYMPTFRNTLFHLRGRVGILHTYLPVPEFYMPTFRNTLFHLRRRVGILHTYLPMSEFYMLTFQNTVFHLRRRVGILHTHLPVPEFYMPTFRNCLFHLRRRVGILHTYLPMSEFYMPTFRNTVPSSYAGRYSSYLPAYEDGTECSHTSAYKIQTPGNYPEGSIQNSEHGESLKSRIIH